jgi:molybdopterin/thiamine biosynthesis adenylyltransferase
MFSHCSLEFEQDLGRCLPVASDGLEVTVISSERDVESDDSLARLDEVEVLGVDAGGLGSVVVEELDLLEETRLVVLVDLGAEFLGGGEVSET